MSNELDFYNLAQKGLKNFGKGEKLWKNLIENIWNRFSKYLNKKQE